MRQDQQTLERIRAAATQKLPSAREDTCRGVRKGISGRTDVKSFSHGNYEVSIPLYLAVFRYTGHILSTRILDYNL